MIVADLTHVFEELQVTRDLQLIVRSASLNSVPAFDVRRCLSRLRPRIHCWILYLPPVWLQAVFAVPPLSPKHKLVI
jgi:hypothetical protein